MLSDLVGERAEDIPDELKPTIVEVEDYGVTNIRHSSRVETIVKALDIKSPGDRERPHDIQGRHSKFDPYIFIRMALEWRAAAATNPQHAARYMEGVIAHRDQYHHRVLNDKNAPVGAIQLAVIDMVVSKTEERPKIYGGSFDGNRFSLYDDAILLSYRGDPRLKPWFEWAVHEIRTLPQQPNTSAIKSLEEFSNIGVSSYMFLKIEQVADRYRKNLKLFQQGRYIVNASQVYKAPASIERVA